MLKESNDWKEKVGKVLISCKKNEKKKLLLNIHKEVISFNALLGQKLGLND